MLALGWVLRQSRLTILNTFLFAFQLISPWFFISLARLLRIGDNVRDVRGQLQRDPGRYILCFPSRRPPHLPTAYRSELCFHGGVAKQNHIAYLPASAAASKELCESPALTELMCSWANKIVIWDERVWYNIWAEMIRWVCAHLSKSCFHTLQIRINDVFFPSYANHIMQNDFLPLAGRNWRNFRRTQNPPPVDFAFSCQNYVRNHSKEQNKLHKQRAQESQL